MTADDARVLYGCASKDTIGAIIWDYTPIIESIGEIIVRVDSDAYAGDTHALLRGEEGYGYLCFGWGSCSGCDALRGCVNWDEIAALADEMTRSVVWRATREDMIEFLNTRDWKGLHVWFDSALMEFLPKACEVLGGECTVAFED